MSEHIEYLPWYHPGSQFLRCSRCGALVVEGDLELHSGWHERMETPPVLQIPDSNELRLFDGTVIEAYVVDGPVTLEVNPDAADLPRQAG